MKTSSAKAKGRRLSQLVRESLLLTFPTIHPDDIEVRPSGVNGEDLALSKEARSLFPFSVEAKNQEKLNIWEAIEQAQGNCKGFTPIVVFARNRTEPQVCISLESFLKLIKKESK